MSLNRTIVSGRLGQINMRGEGEKKFISGSIAVQRNFKNKDGEYGTDWVSFTVSGEKRAEAFAKLFDKGSEVILEGELREGKYKEVSTLQLSVSNFYFTGGSKKPTNSQEEPIPSPDDDGFMTIPDDIEQELPFN